MRPASRITRRERRRAWRKLPGPGRRHTHRTETTWGAGQERAAWTATWQREEERANIEGATVMDTATAFTMGEANRGNRMRVFDWDHAASIIANGRVRTAAAGLRGDWEWTGGPILRDGQPVPSDDTYTYLASTWAIPELNADGAVMPCWRWEDESPGWDAHTYWPQSALAILRGPLALEGGK